MNKEANANQPQPPQWANRIAHAVAYLAGWLLTGASAATSVMGAIKMVSQSKLVACALALGMNLMLFATAHSLNQALPPAGYKYSRAGRLQVWLLTFCFSVWLSFVGFFDMYQAEVVVEDSSHAISICVWNRRARGLEYETFVFLLSRQRNGDDRIRRLPDLFRRGSDA